MTVIAWDGKILAADMQITSNTTVSITTKIKLVETRSCDKYLIGVTGSIGDLQAFCHWFTSENDSEKYPKNFIDDSAAAIVINEAGEINLYETTPFGTLLQTKTFAIGSGKQFAMAAMYYGKSAIEGVHLACQFDAYCGQGIDTLKF